MQPETTMTIVSTKAFTNKQATTVEDLDIPVGREMVVTAQRGAQLIALGLAEAVQTEPATSKK